MSAIAHNTRGVTTLRQPLALTLLSLTSTTGLVAVSGAGYTVTGRPEPAAA